MHKRMLSSARSKVFGIAAVVAVGALVMAGCTPNLTLQAVPLPSSTQSEAYAINNLGQAVGYYYPTSVGAEDHAFLYDSKTNVTTDIPPIPVSTQFPKGGTMTDADGINDSGVIVGESNDSQGAVAYDSVSGSWQAMPGCANPGKITNGGLVACGSGIYDLPTNTFQPIVGPPGATCQIVGANDFGKAIENCAITSSSLVAFVIDLKTDVEIPIGTDLGTSAVCVMSISDADVVVGVTNCGGAGGASKPFAYDVSGSTPVRETLGLYDYLAALYVAISDNGIVAVTALIPATNEEPFHLRIGTYNVVTNTAGAYDDSSTFDILNAVNNSSQAVGAAATEPPPSNFSAFYGKLPVAG